MNDHIDQTLRICQRMKGWSPEMVFALPRGVHKRLVLMLQADDAPQSPTPGFTMTEGFNDR